MARKLKIEVNCIRTDEYGKVKGTKNIVVRVPDSMKIIDHLSIYKLGKERFERKKTINEWRKKLGKPEFKIYSNCFYVGWSPIINSDKLEIIQNYL